MCGAFGEYVCRREHVCLRAENMYFSCAVDAAWYVHQPFHGPFFGGLCTILTCEPRTLQNRCLAAFFGGVRTHKNHFRSRAEGAAKIYAACTAPMQRKWSMYCGGACAAAPQSM